MRQCQVIQHSLERMTMRLAVERPLSAAEEQGLAARLITSLGFRVAVDFEYFADRIPRAAGGKFEDFISEIGGP